MREYRLSKSQDNILVSETAYDEIGLPIKNKLGIIRVKPGTAQLILENADAKAKLDKFQFNGVVNKDSGLCEMELPVTTAVPTTETADVA